MTYRFGVEFHPEHDDIQNLIIQRLFSILRISQNNAKCAAFGFELKIEIYRFQDEILPQIDRSHDNFKNFGFLKS